LIVAAMGYAVYERQLKEWRGRYRPLEATLVGV